MRREIKENGGKIYKNASIFSFNKHPWNKKELTGHLICLKRERFNLKSLTNKVKYILYLYINN